MRLRRNAAALSLAAAVLALDMPPIAAEDPPPAPHAGVPARQRPWNVVVYVIDTLRADHVGCYEATSDATPRIDAFAREAVRFAHGVSQSSWTLPSIASLLTGLRASRHGATGPAHAVRTDVATLPQLLAASGYTTAGFVTNYLGSGAFGLDRGFDRFRFYRERGATRRKVYLRSDALHRRIIRWLDRKPGMPFLLWVHATDPHFPYLPPRRHRRWRRAAAAEPDEVDRVVDALRPLHNGNEAWGARPAAVSPETVALLRDLYAGEVRAADLWFGRLIDQLAARGLLDETVVVLTSDHGEEFLEHGGLAHGQTLHREVLDVPVIVRLPRGADGGTVVDGFARHVDVLPTILAIVGVSPPSGLDGVALLGAAGAKPADAYAAVRLGRFDQDAVLTPTWKAIRNLNTSRIRLFDVVSDPLEQTDVARSDDPRLRQATSRLDELARPREVGPRVGGDRIERLRALGYLAD
jgi:arylsulfatase A-like enzyme